MNYLFRNCIYQGKNLFRDPGFLFWALAYPLVLVFFFNTAFSGMMDFEARNIDVGIGNDNQIAYILKEIEFFNVHEITDNKIVEKLESGEISAFIDNKLNLMATESGINQTIIKEVVEQIKQTSMLNRPVTEIDFSVDYLADRNQEANIVAVTFYALIAMVSLYGIFAGIETVCFIQANLSNVGVRINVTPLKKANFLLAGAIDALLLNLLSNGILFLFITYVLKITLFNELLYSAGLIILGSLIVQKQINFMVTKDRGYDSENIMMLTMWQMNPNTRKSFIEELESMSAVKSVSTSDVYFGEDPSMNAAYFETMEDENFFHTSVFPVDDEFLATFDLEMKEGRFFDEERQSDFNAVVLNEAALKKYAGEESIIGKEVIVNGNYKVIGAVKDFNFRSLHHNIQPLVMTRIENFGNVFVKIRKNQTPEVIEIAENLWKKHPIEIPFQYTFHDEVFARHYIKDQQARKLLFILSIISISIACVGLYAISFFTIVRKTKEIGIRKVNGAAALEVMSMLSLRFLIGVGLAFLLAIPVSYYAMNKWLENFAYKTTLSWWIFALAGLLALGIALLTVSWQSWKAATRNPVEALRYE